MSLPIPISSPEHFLLKYGDALSGVFDIKHRSGNPSSHEYTLALGTMGADVSSQGPFGKNGKSSYIFNYRYSTLALMACFLPDGASAMRYQDLSFKLNFPTRKFGTLSLWGVGLIDRNCEKPKLDSCEWEYKNDREGWENRLYMGAADLTYNMK